MPMNAEKCEATISYKDLKQSAQRIVYNSFGDRIDLGSGVKEEPGIGERIVACEGCELSETLTAQGMGFIPYNETARNARDLLKQRCKKWTTAEAEYADRLTKSFSHLYSPPNPETFFPK